MMQRNKYIAMQHNLRYMRLTNKRGGFPQSWSA